MKLIFCIFMPAFKHFSTGYVTCVWGSAQEERNRNSGAKSNCVPDSSRDTPLPDFVCLDLGLFLLEVHFVPCPTATALLAKGDLLIFIQGKQSRSVTSCTVTMQIHFHLFLQELSPAVI